MSRSTKALYATALFLPAAAAFLRRRRLARGGGMADIKEIARRLAEDPWTGKLDEVIELVADDYIGHDPSYPEPIRGKQGFRDFVQTYLGGFPDGRITVDTQIAEGDIVVNRWTGRGTNTGELMGMPPTGKQVTVTGITIARIEDGKLQEDWSNWDTLGMLQQLGVVPALAGAET
jgi:steroid delta-isomerase-like uncharacterized protein